MEIQMADRLIKAGRPIGDAPIVTGAFGFA
jgi:hypothetical protein